MTSGAPTLEHGQDAPASGRSSHSPQRSPRRAASAALRRLAGLLVVGLVMGLATSLGVTLVRPLPASALYVPNFVVPPSVIPGVGAAATSTATGAVVGSATVTVGSGLAVAAAGIGAGYLIGTTGLNLGTSVYRWAIKTSEYGDRKAFFGFRDGSYGGNDDFWVVDAEVTSDEGSFNAVAQGIEVKGEVGPYPELKGATEARCKYSAGPDRFSPKYNSSWSGGLMAAAMCPLLNLQADGVTFATLVSVTGNGTTAKVNVQPYTSRIITDWDCVTSSGQVTANSASATIGGSGEVEVPAATCPAGSILRNVHVHGNAPVGQTPESFTTWTLPPEFDPSTGGVIPSPVVPLTPTGQPGDWANTDPSTGEVTDPSTGEVTPSPGCQWGSRTLTAEECYADPPTTTPTAPPTAPSPSPSTPVPVPTDPGETPTPTPTPGGPGEPDPGDDGSSCFPDGWGAFNPLQWVYQPVKCALTWAFVPEEPIGPKVQDIGIILIGIPPLSWPGDMMASFPTPTALGAASPICPDWNVRVGEWEKTIVCDSSYIAALQAGRPLLLGFMVLVAVGPFFRSLFYSVLPFVRPVPTA